MRHTLLGVILFVSLAAFGWGAEPEAVPLPRQALYMPQGLQAGMGVGSVWRSHCQSRFQWMGGVDYSYKPWLTGGGAVRMFGGDIDSKNSLVFTRYIIQSRFHAHQTPKLDVYIGPIFGFDKTSFQEIREQWKGLRDTLVADHCPDAYESNGPSLGWDAGIGYRIHQYWAITGSNTAEINLDKKMRVQVSGGLAFSIWAFSERLQQYLGAAWVHMDLIKAFTIHSGGSENSLLLGLSAAM